MQRTDAEWRELLSPIAYQVTRLGGTERPWTGDYNEHRASGTYHCICCDEPLFQSETKFDSHCGWPAFTSGEAGGLKELVDLSHGMRRTEIRCSNCDAHLGHVFNDGPPPLGTRYCINSVALRFEPSADQ